MRIPYEKYNWSDEQNYESRQSEIDSAIKDTKSELTDFQSTLFWWQKTNYVDKVNELEWNIKTYIENIIQESIDTWIAPYTYTRNIKETLTYYIISWRSSTNKNPFLEFQLNELNRTSNNWKLRYLIDNPQKSVTELVNNIKKKLEVMDLFNKHTQYDDIINRYSEKYNVDPLLIKSIIKKESEFNPKATSPAWAKWLMQLMPITEKEVNRRKEWTITDVYNPEQNIEGWTMIFSSNLKKFNWNINHALIAYNRGWWNLNNLVKKTANSLNITTEKLLNNNKLFNEKVFRRLPNETRKYVNTIMSMYKAISI